MEPSSRDRPEFNLATGLCQLRDVSPADLPLFFEHQLQPMANEMAAIPSRNKVTFMAHWQNIINDENVIKQAIIASGQAVGKVVCWQQDDQHLIGFWLAQESWGRGFATAALLQFLPQIGTRPLYTYVAKHNAGSIGVLEQCGFVNRREGGARDKLSGKPIQELMFELPPVIG